MACLTLVEASITGKISADLKVDFRTKLKPKKKDNILRPNLGVHGFAVPNFFVYRVHLGYSFLERFST